MWRGLGLSLLFVVGLTSWTAAARSRSMWEGVYTAEQASRGERAYRRTCADCHGPALAGTEQGPELVGDVFWTKWYGSTVGNLLEQMRLEMPQDDPGTLGAQQAADIFAYILQANLAPAGSADLPGAPEPLADILIERKAP